MSLRHQISKALNYSKKAKNEAKKAHSTSNSALTIANSAINTANLSYSAIINNYAVCFPILNSYAPGDSLMQWMIEPTIGSNGISISTNNVDIIFANAGVYYFNLCMNCNSTMEGRIQVTLYIGLDGTGTAIQYTEDNRMWTTYSTFNAFYSIKVLAGQTVYFVLTNDMESNWNAEPDTYWSRLQINQVN